MLDARDPLGTRCRYLEHHLRKHARHKHLLLLLNKCDLVRSPARARTTRKRMPHMLCRQTQCLRAWPGITCAEFFLCGSGPVMINICPYHQSFAVTTSFWNLVSLRPLPPLLVTCCTRCAPTLFFMMRYMLDF